MSIIWLTSFNASQAKSLTPANAEAAALAALGTKRRLSSFESRQTKAQLGRDTMESDTRDPSNRDEENMASDSASGLDVESMKATDVSAFKCNLEKYRHTNGAETQSSTSTRRLRGHKRSIGAGKTTIEPSSPSPAKKRKQSSRYAPPSKYAHLPPLQDVLDYNLICIFVGTNPGVRTATAGHAYAHPSNSFWKLLHSSGCTDVRLRPEQDVDLPRLYSMGNTNIVSRPSKDAGELSKAEMAAGTPVLEEKVREFRPEAVCIVGKGIWEAVWRWRYGRPMRKDEFKYGWQSAEERMGKDQLWGGADVFVATSTSGLSASLKPYEKEAIWAPFGAWVKEQREERARGLAAAEKCLEEGKIEEGVLEIQPKLAEKGKSPVILDKHVRGGKKMEPVPDFRPDVGD